MSDRYVRPNEDGWSVLKPDATRASEKAAAQAEAITRAVEIVANDGGGKVIVHGADDTHRETREVPSNSEDTDRIAAELATAAAATGASRTARAAAEEAGAAAEEIGDDARTTAKKVAGETRHGADRIEATADAAAEGIGNEASKVLDGDKSVRAAARNMNAIADTTGDQITDQADRTARQVAGEARAAARRTGDVLEREADRAGEALVAGTDRAARVGQRAEDELQTAAARAGHRIHTLTEAAATPLDDLAATLNPIRVTGRALSAVTVVGLRLVARATGQGTDAAHRGARQVAGR